MKKLLLMCAALACITGAFAQKLVIGEKAPDLRTSQWLWGGPSDDNRAKLIEFFHSGSQQCTGRIGNIEAIAQRYRTNLNVIVLAKEPAETVSRALGTNSGTYFAAIDDGSRTFDSYGVRFVPFCVLVDGRGKVVWFGNPASLDSDEIGRLIR